MNAIQVFLLGIGLVILIIAAVGIWWLSSRGTSMKLPGISLNGWVLVGVIAVILVIDYLIGNPLISFVSDVFTDEGRPKFWLISISVAVVLGILLLVVYRQKGSELLQGIIIAATIVALGAFVLDTVGDAPNTKTARGCVTEPFFSTNDGVSETKRLVTLDGSRPYYQVWVPHDGKGNFRGRDFRIKLADKTLPGYPEIELGDTEDFITVVRYGEAGEKAYGLGPGRLYLYLNRDTFRKRANGSCLNFYVYLENS